MDRNIKPIKLVFLCPLNNSKNEIGGADIHIKHLLKQMSKIEELDIHVITLSKTLEKSSKKNQEGITYHVLKSPRLPKTITGISVDYRALIKKVNEIKPDIVHAQILGAPYGLAAMKLCKHYPTVLTVHTLIDMDAKNRSGTMKEKIHDAIWQNLEKKEIKSIPHFIVVSKNIENEMKKRGAQNVHVIPNGILESWFKVPYIEVEGRILFVGRVIPVKAIENLIQALKIVRNKIPNAQLHIVGSISDREYKKKLDELINDLELQNYVTFRGSKSGPELEKEYGECSIFVLPSKNESFGIVLLEAMAVGKPIVATRVGAIPELVRDKINGYLIEPTNKKEMADRIVHLLSEKAIRTQMSMAGKDTAKLFGWDGIARKTLDTYIHIISQRGEAR